MDFTERTPLDRRGAGDRPDWARDSLRMQLAIETTARMLIDARERAFTQEKLVRDAALRQGHSIDTRADYAAGSGAAYAIACSILAGALRVSAVDEIAQEWQPERGMMRPELPSELAEPERAVTLPDGTLALGDHFAYPRPGDPDYTDAIDPIDGGRNDR